VPGKISQVLCLGNATSSPSTLEFLKSLSPDFQIVKGEFDDNSTIPLSLVITHGSLRIGFTNGYTIVPRGDPLSLLTMARQLNADVLIWGGTHKVEAYTLEGKFFVNPGSATGAFSTEWPELDDVEGTKDEDYKAQEGEVQKDDTEATEEKKEAAEEPNENNGKLNSEDDNDTDEETVPSFTLLDIQGSLVTLYIYTYTNGEVKVDKVSYRKSQ
jgi:vacuolar protein sorting-associated protein 29